MSADRLQQIQTLQFHDREQAQNLLLTFLREIYSPDVQKVELRPLAVSLNSFNGFLTLSNGTRLFFKTHTEPDGVIGEYYHAAQLAQAGYPVIQPVFSSTEAGKQLLIYEVINDPSVFDVAWEIETGKREHFAALTQAQQAADDHLFQLYQQSLGEQNAADAEKAPVHQLFYHRLTGGRLDRFYGRLNGQPDEYPSVSLPDGSHSMAEVRQARWVINGQEYADTLETIIQRAVTLLNPAQGGPSIIGHGDAHNGNVFFRSHQENASLLYFDPAFAGRHHPLLDLTKPMFHNVFAMWMYFARVKRDQLTISLQVDGDLWKVDHDYTIAEVREMFLSSKVDRVLVPVMRELKQMGQLRLDWRAYFKSALFCCPFLTMNLTDAEKFPPEIALLGLSMAVEMGAESRGKRSRIDSILDGVEQSI